ncbi:MAG: NUDIX domain-containing protein [Acidiferrobacterales bacterium]
MVAAIIEYDRSILACVRAESPYAGELDLPGGFVDHEETAEQALRRELKEELNLREFMPVYLGSYPDVYPYKSVTYRTLTLTFAVRLHTIPDITPADDVASIAWIKRSDLKVEDFAFASMQAALSAYDRTN